MSVVHSGAAPGRERRSRALWMFPRLLAARLRDPLSARIPDLVLLAFVAAAIAVMLAVPDAAAQTGNSAVFDKLVEVGEDTHAGIITVVRILGVVAFVVFGGIMVAGGFKPRLLVGGVVGLLIAGFANPIVQFLFRA